MNYVQLPQSFVGYEDLYYESFRLAHSFLEVKFVERKLCYEMQKYIH